MAIVGFGGSTQNHSHIREALSSAQKNTSRLASGENIQNVAEDVAGFAVGKALEAKVSIFKAASTNISQASALLQNADGALGLVDDILQRMNSLAAQSSSGSLTDADRAFYQSESTQLVAELDRIVSNTTFNGKKLVDGSFGAAVTYNSGDSLATYSGEAAINILDSRGKETDISTISIVDVAGTNAGEITAFSMTYDEDTGSAAIKMTMGDTDYSVTATNAELADIHDAGTDGLIHLVDSGPTNKVDLNFSGLANTSADFSGKEGVQRLEAAIKNAILAGVDFQVGAENSDKIAVKIGAADSTTLGINGLDISTATTAKAALTTIGSALTTVSNVRANVGAYMSRFDQAKSAAETAIQNQDAARGIFLDTDVVKTAAELAKNEVQAQAGISAESKLIQQGNYILSLLR